MTETTLTIARLREMLRCPSCLAELSWHDADVTCFAGHCFPLVQGIPMLTLDDESETEAHQHAQQTRYYDREYGAYLSYRLENWQQTYVDRLRLVWEVCGQNAAFLDSGVGGSAYTVIEAARAGLPAIGCDISVEGMAAARRLAESQGVGDRCLFVVCRAERLPFADGAFGGAASIAVLEHVPDDARAFGELARVTRRGGRIFLAVPNTLDRVARPFRAVYRRHDRRVGHLRHYSNMELIEKARLAGFRPIRTAYSAHWIKVWQLAIHLMATRLRIPDDRLWWWMERKDAALAHRDNGMHLNLWLDRT